MPDAFIFVCIFGVFFLVMVGISFRLLGDFLERMDQEEALDDRNL